MRMKTMKSEHCWEVCAGFSCKGALCRFEERIFINRERFSTSVLPCLSKLNKQTLISLWVTLFLCGGPCHLSSYQQCSGDLIFLWEQLVYSVMEKNKYIWVCIKYQNSFSWCFFKLSPICSYYSVEHDMFSYVHLPVKENNLFPIFCFHYLV